MAEARLLFGKENFRARGRYVSSKKWQSRRELLEESRMIKEARARATMMRKRARDRLNAMNISCDDPDDYLNASVLFEDADDCEGSFQKQPGDCLNAGNIKTPGKQAGDYLNASVLFDMNISCADHEDADDWEGSFPDEESVPDGASIEHLRDFKPIWSRYYRQVQDSNGFDADDYPGGSLGAAIIPDLNFATRKGDLELLMELADSAIKEYNDKEGSVFKYKVLKIEKVNFMLTGYFEYFMTVKVLNVTVGSLIETFQIHAGTKIPNRQKKVFLCRKKV